MSGELAVMVGPAGCGKTTWLFDKYDPHQVLSLDRYRLQLTDDEADQTVHAEAVSLRAIVLEERMSRNLATVADSTNAVTVHRLAVLKVAERWSRPTVAVLFHTPLQVCIDRQAERRRPTRTAPRGKAVPDSAIRSMFSTIAERWSTLAREVHCVVHVSPDGDVALRVGDLPLPAGDRPRWLDETPAIPGVEHLPWEVPYGH